MKHLILLIFVTFLLLSSSNFTMAQGKTTTSIINGSWCSTASWNNGIPDPSKDSIIIDGGFD